MYKKFIMPEWSDKEQLKMSKETAWKRNKFWGKWNVSVFLNELNMKKKSLKNEIYICIFLEKYL